MYHFVLSTMLLATLIGAGVNLFKSFGTDGLYSASLVFVLALGVLFNFFFYRTFALKAQDRAIRVEENFRHYIITGKPLDSKLDIRQIISLRFASDDEFVELAKKAANENMSEDDIKKAIKNWRTDTYRV